MKEVCLTCYRYLPTFWSHTWGTPFWHWAQRQPGEHPLRKGVSVHREHLSFQESSKPSGLQARVFSLSTPMLLTGLKCACEHGEGLLLCFVVASSARRFWRMHWEPLRAATRLCCSLLGNAGGALARGRSGRRAGFASMLWAWSLHANSQGCLYKTRHLAAVSSSTLLSDAGPRQRSLVQEQSGRKSAAPAFLLRPSPLYLMQEPAFSTPLCSTYPCSPPSL